jgi:hypothetical protein
MDRKFFVACGLDAEALQEFIASGATDAEVAAWMSQNAATPQMKITDWSRRFLANPLWRLLDLEDWLHVRGAQSQAECVGRVRQIGPIPARNPRHAVPTGHGRPTSLRNERSAGLRV